MEWFGYISAVCFFIAYLPQLWRTYKLKTVDDISIWMWGLTLVAYISGLAYGVYLGKEPLVLSYLLGMGCTILMIVMYTLYEDPRKDYVRKIVRDILKDVRRKK